MNNIIKRKIGLIILILFICSTFAFAVTCEVNDVRVVLKKVLYKHFTNPSESPLSLDEVKDLLSFYLGIDQGMVEVECSVSGQNSNRYIVDIIYDGENITDTIPSCSDGTKYGECSSTKPYYCFNGKLIVNCEICGCQLNEICENNACVEIQNNQSSQCGDGSCNGLESCETCIADCGACGQCVDTDGGRDYFVKGSCSDLNPDIDYDSCNIYSNQLRETYCEDGECVYQFINCSLFGMICPEFDLGICIDEDEYIPPTVACSDTDGDIPYPDNMLVKGTCTDKSGSYEDTESTYIENGVREYYCTQNPDPLKQICAMTDYSCSYHFGPTYIYEDGACVDSNLGEYDCGNAICEGIETCTNCQLDCGNCDGSCFDSDGGRNSWIKGWTIKDGETKKDRCYEGPDGYSRVVEYYCGLGDLIDSISYNCGAINAECIDGECVPYSHTECINNQCTVVPGEGEDQCGHSIESSCNVDYSITCYGNLDCGEDYKMQVCTTDVNLVKVYNLSFCVDRGTTDSYCTNDFQVRDDPNNPCECWMCKPGSTPKCEQESRTWGTCRAIDPELHQECVGSSCTTVFTSGVGYCGGFNPPCADAPCVDSDAGTADNGIYVKGSVSYGDEYHDNCFNFNQYQIVIEATCHENGFIDYQSINCPANYICVDGACRDPSYSPVCGDDICSVSESCESCLEDCGSCRLYCGDGNCNSSETCATCPGDCGACASTCGNDICDGNETCETCYEDCPVCICGDGECSFDEYCTTCPEDCGECPVCGDDLCQGEFDEMCDTCPEDCGQCPVCGDGTCEGNETCINCQTDCGSCTYCGDGTCDQNETCETCIPDCGACYCGDGDCNGDETCNDCPEDCGECPPTGDWTINLIDNTQFPMTTSISIVGENIYGASDLDYFGRDIKFLKSTDAGETFSVSTVYNSITSVRPKVYAIDDTNLFITFYDMWNDDYRLATSTNGGNSWLVTDIATNVQSNGHSDLKVVNQNDLFFAYDCENSVCVAKSTNGGSSWNTQVVETIITSSGTTEVSIDTIGTNNIYIFYDHQVNLGTSTKKLAKSTDGGSNWQILNVDVTGSYSGFVDIDAVDTNNLFVTYRGMPGSALMYARSSNSGSSWTKKYIEIEDSDSSYPNYNTAEIYAITSNNILLTAHQYSNNDALYFAESVDGGDNWATEGVDFGTKIGHGVSIDMSGSNIYLLYGQDDTPEGLKLAKK